MPNKYLDSVGLTEYTGLVKTALNAKAPLSSPALTGTPTAPTPTAGDDSTKIATTEFVQDAIDSEETRADGAYLPLAGGTVTGNLSVSGSITGNVTGNASTATNATNDANGNPIANTYLPLAGGTLTGAVNGVTPTAGDESTKLATTAYVREEVRQHSGIPIGHIYFSVNPNIPQGSLPLFGGEFSRDTYSDLWAWVQQQAGYCKTEAEWQALATNNNNNVPYYSSGDGSTTFRVPSLRCWVKGADGTVVEVGSYLEAGVPNITGSATTTYSVIRGDVTGALYGSTPNTGTNPTTSPVFSNNVTTGRISFDASHSNSIYGNASTVQPESIVGMWLVKAYGTIVDTGQIDEQQYIDDRIATCLPLTGGTMTGQIHTNYYKLASQTSNNKYVEIDGGTNASSGASLILFGMDESREGQFWLSTHNGTTAPRLTGNANGTLTWGNKVLSAGSGRLLSASGSMALTQGQYTNLCSVTLKKSISDKWLVTGWSCIASNSSATLTMALIGISSNTAARYSGANGGGASLTLAVEISSDLVVYTAVNPSVAGLTGRGTMHAVPIM